VQIADIFPDFEDLRDSGFAGLTLDRPVIMIAMTPRTGSTYLCAALAQAGHLGEPGECFSPRGGIQSITRGAAMSFAGYIATLAASPGDAFLFKTCWYDFAPLAAGWRQLFPQLTILYLDRQDIIAQAISFHLAKATGRWHTPDAAASTDPAYDEAAIRANMQALLTEKRAWQSFFTAEALSPPTLWYETLSRDPHATLARIATLTGLTLDPSRHRTPYQRLADARSADWLARARRDILRLT
jgi:LPS sulfotransferase NodH